MFNEFEIFIVTNIPKDKSVSWLAPAKAAAMIETGHVPEP
jgi:hypothetical protein